MANSDKSPEEPALWVLSESKIQFGAAFVIDGITLNSTDVAFSASPLVFDVVVFLGFFLFFFKNATAQKIGLVSVILHALHIIVTLIGYPAMGDENDNDPETGPKVKRSSAGNVPRRRQHLSQRIRSQAPDNPRSKNDGKRIINRKSTQKASIYCIIADRRIPFLRQNSLLLRRVVILIWSIPHRKPVRTKPCFRSRSGPPPQDGKTNYPEQRRANA